jgi:hypothetical protein
MAPVLEPPESSGVPTILSGVNGTETGVDAWSGFKAASFEASLGLSSLELVGYILLIALLLGSGT